jgi:AraC-like DNA-binding protein
LFASFNGLSPWEYITIRRIEQSKELLRDTDFSVLEVATRCGFGNLSNFNRKFSRIAGMTPLAYRKKEKTKYSINSP